MQHNVFAKAVRYLYSPMGFMIELCVVFIDSTNFQYEYDIASIQSDFALIHMDTHWQREQ